MAALKEIHHLMKNLYSISNGQAKLVKFESSKKTIDIYLELSPTDGLYKGGNFLFIVQIYPEFSKSYVNAIKCLSPIYHPNINARDTRYGETNVCLNILDEGQESLGLTGIVAGLLYLLYNPQLDDPLTHNYAGLTPEQFQANVKAYMKGETFTGSFTERDQQEYLYTYIGQREDANPVLEDEVQEEAMDTDDEESDSFRPLENSEAKQLYSLIQHQNSIVKLESACASDGQREITPFNAPENFREEFNGYKLTKHGTTVIPNEDVGQTFSMNSPVQPFFLLTKRFTA